MSEDVFLNYIDSLNHSEKRAIDIGANKGMYVERLVKKFSHVHALEPHPDNYKELVGKYGHKGNVVVHQIALGTSSEPTRLWTNANPGGHTISEKIGLVTNWGHRAESFIEVQQTTLDEFTKELTDIALIKCDCEGAEDFIFEHGKQTLLNNDLVLLLEVHQTVDLERLYNLFIDCGYSIQTPEQSPVSKLVHDRHYFISRK